MFGEIPYVPCKDVVHPPIENLAMKKKLWLQVPGL